MSGTLRYYIASTNGLKVLRGNGFQKGGHYFLDAYRYVFYRTEVDPDEFFENVGFRCVLPLPTSS